MGQKVHPVSFRLGFIRDWNSRWYASKEEFPKKLLQDIKIRKLINKDMASASISKVLIERATKRIRITIHSGRPGMLIGRKGIFIEKLKEDVQKMVGVDSKLHIDIKEIRNAVMDAQLVSDNLAFQLLKRIAFRRAMKKSIQLLKDAGGEGIKIKCAGRLGGAEIARSETYKWGKVPLQTIRADIDYGFSEARTPYGIIGIKVWIYKGEKFNTPKRQKKEVLQEVEEK